MSNEFRLPTIQLANANAQSCQTHALSGACSEYWYPAGPAMNTEFGLVYSDSTHEFTDLQLQSPTIDFADLAVPSVDSYLTQDGRFLVSGCRE